MKNNFIKYVSCIMIAFIVFFAMPSEALALGTDISDSIETTLTDIEEQKGSILNFDVWARDAEGNKIDCTVTLNGQEVHPAWNDVSKTSFKPKFNKAGENIIVITAGDASKTFTVNYTPVKVGDSIGKATVSIEVFTLGAGYLVDPVIVDVKEGDNAAKLLDRVLKENGYTYDNTGTLDSSFYLASISGGRLPIEAEIPDVLKERLDTISNDNNQDTLGEFNYNSSSGWMYCINGVFPNVGFADYNLSDGDVMRIQFTLAYGSDIGGGSAMGYGYAEDYYTVADKDELTKLIAENGIENAPEEVIKVVTQIDSSQEDVEEAENILRLGKTHSFIRIMQAYIKYIEYNFYKIIL